MTTPSSTAVKQAGQGVVRKAQHAAANPWVERLMRFGYLVRGLVYVIIGVLALQLAMGAGGATASPTSAIALIGQQPLGRWLLAIVVAGLVGYALWGFIRAILDPLGRGTDAKGWLERTGFFFSGVSYGVLAIPTALTLLNKPSTSTGGGLPAGLASGQLGQWATVAFGLVWIIAGIAQLVTAYLAHFTLDLKTSTMSAATLKAATWLGRIGFAARGIVFALVGIIVLQTAFAVGGQQAPGFDGALAALAHGPYGAVVLGFVALGLILFGVFSALCAKWSKVNSVHAA